MTDLRARFRSLDRLPAPYLWNEIELRAGQPATAPSTGGPSPMHPQRRLPTRSRWLAAWAPFKVAVVAIIVLAVGLGLGRLLPVADDVGTDPTPSSSPVASAIPLRPGWLPAGTYRTTPFGSPHDLGLCLIPPQSGCSEATDDDGIGFTLTLPDGWAGAQQGGVWRSGWENGPPDGVTLYFERGGWIQADPCAASGIPAIVVGPTVDDFVAALVDHPLLVASAPVPVTLGGYSGTYLDLTLSPEVDRGRSPDDRCDAYEPWSPGIDGESATGGTVRDLADPWQRWHLWVLDVDGQRVVVRSADYAATSPEIRAQLQAVVESIVIDHQPPDPHATPGARLPCIGSTDPLEPGRYVMPGPGVSCSVQSRGWPDRTVSVDLPAGWSYRGPARGSALDRDSARLQMGVVGHVRADPCLEGWTRTGSTLDDLVVALAAMRGVRTTAPEAITLDGYAGMRMDLVLPTDPRDCDSYRLWDTRTDTGYFGSNTEPAWIHRLWILDVEGVRFVLDASRAPATPPELQSELDAIVRSVDFAP